MRASQNGRRIVTAGVLLAAMCGCDSTTTHDRGAAGSNADLDAGLRLELMRPKGEDIACIELAGLSAKELQAFNALEDSRRPAIMQVFAGKTMHDDIPPIVGTTSVAGGALRFTPRYPLGDGLECRVRVDRSALASNGSAGIRPRSDAWSGARSGASWRLHRPPRSDRAG